MSSDVLTLLAIDAGNTRIKCGLFRVEPEASRVLPECAGQWAFATGAAVDPAAIGVTDPATPAIITGSNPAEVERIVAEWPVTLPQPLRLSDRSSLPLKIDVDFPEKVGIDRLLNAIAANQIRSEGEPAILIDSGTATTIDYVNADGTFCGGAILPGFELCARALNQYTALLPHIPMHELLARESLPDEVGRNTEAAITSGLYWGHVGAVNGLLRRQMHLAGRELEETGGPAAMTGGPLVLLTGGAATLLQPHMPSIVRYEPHLSLQGLAFVAASQHRAVATD
ncbi:Type III pantothenate kinase [Maioricimonas rarisocia]|uniref:Type III pantothenate kinase n=1 Tax=Maioricimonas rarisocia TaxID=2528026 RepID=A0A517Z7C5_9PLAN|nr:type III pantothenate kinase [Maioricimonas rarisocia]QDU38377.1 Type III pantothenate kinase [Maioricimonas rarisocia]